MRFDIKGNIPSHTENGFIDTSLPRISSWMFNFSVKALEHTSNLQWNVHEYSLILPLDLSERNIAFCIVLYKLSLKLIQMSSKYEEKFFKSRWSNRRWFQCSRSRKYFFVVVDHIMNEWMNTNSLSVCRWIRLERRRYICISHVIVLIVVERALSSGTREWWAIYNVTPQWRDFQAGIRLSIECWRLT